METNRIKISSPQLQPNNHGSIIKINEPSIMRYWEIFLHEQSDGMLLSSTMHLKMVLI
jgi:hypothetical protein